MCLNYNLSIQETFFGPFMVHDVSYAKGGSLSVEQQRGCYNESPFLNKLL